jgi:hypothetical protein
VSLRPPSSRQQRRRKKVSIKEIINLFVVLRIKNKKNNITTGLMKIRVKNKRRRNKKRRNRKNE